MPTPRPFLGYFFLAFPDRINPYKQEFPRRGLYRLFEHSRD
jgi:hypothetical protein